MRNLLVESVCPPFEKDLTYCLELRCDKRVTSKLSENRCTVYYEVLVTQMKAYKEQQESEESDRETALKSALVGMSFVTNEKGKNCKQNGNDSVPEEKNRQL